MEICTRCMLTESQEQRILRELSRARNRSIAELMRQMSGTDVRGGYLQTESGMESLRQRASEFTRERLADKATRQEEYQEMLRQLEEELSYQVMDRILDGGEVEEAAQQILRDKERQELERQIGQLEYETGEVSTEDLEQSLREYMEKGDIDLEHGKVRITPKGARKLAGNVLHRILEKLSARELGPHTTKEMGYGVEFSISSRKYELGDEYDRINFEQTFLNALERSYKGNSIRLETQDFQVYEEIHQTRMCSGLIIDESGSMSGDKMNAATDTALALAELIRREPRDSLSVYLFSSQVRKVPYYDILNTPFAGGLTDIRAALRAFRAEMTNKSGDKQAYLITDTEPNMENGRHIGLASATSGLVQEALHYRRAGITLNIIMLDQNDQLR
ncbi:MAG: hypothetical protein SVY53_08915, partial [Chloroflexota bacterium]|nr:hypothetical protein [Chloroflexota bacterium]